MRLCPRCHASHPDQITVCMSAACAPLGTPLVLRQHTVTDALVIPEDPSTPVGTTGATPAAQGKNKPAISAGGTAIGPAPAPPTPAPINQPRAMSPAAHAKRPTAAFVAPGRGNGGALVGGPARAIDPTGPVVVSSPGPTEDASAAALGSQPGETAALIAPEKKEARSPRKVESRAEDLVGKVLGSYKVQKVIGKGGMGRVYRAEHVKLGRQVALKLLKPEYAVKRDAVARFFGEAKAVNKIRHRNIVDVTDFVELDDGTTFIIMELLEGQSLGRILRDGGPMPEERALSILAQVCDALAAAHAVGIIHRDLKPDNVFVCPDDLGDLAKLLDFGVAKLLLSESQSVGELGWQTAAGSVVGTPTYMSPEQAGGLEIDGRSDVYSLGAIMYEIFTGGPPFKARSFGEFVLKHINEPPVPPRRTPGGASMRESLEAICLKCLAKRPDERYASATELRDALVAEMADPGILRGGRRRVPAASMPPPVVAAPVAAPPPPVPPVATGTPPAGLPDPPSGAVVAPSVSGSVSVASLIPSITDQAGKATEYAGPGPRKGGRHPIGLIVAFGAAALIAAVVAWVMTTSKPARPVAVTPPAPEPVKPPVQTRVAPPPPQPTRERKITVRSIPDGADVYAKGAVEPLCKTPCEVFIDLDDASSSHFELKLPGYETRPLDVDLGDPTNPPTVSLVKEGGAAPQNPPQVTPNIKRPGGKPGEKPPGNEKPPGGEKPPVETHPTPPEHPTGVPIDPSKTLNPFGKPQEEPAKGTGTK